MPRVAAGLLLLAAWPAYPADPNAAALKDKWVRIGDADFELFTNAGDTAAREALRQLQQVRGFFLKASPLPLLDEFPVRIIVFKSPEQFAHYVSEAGRTAFYVPGPKRDYIVMSDSPNEYRYAIHEYMHLIVRHSGLHLPTWLNEGWADVYSTLKPVDDGVAVGDLLDARVHTLLLEKWLDIDTLTTITPASPIYQGKGQTEVFYAESWALAHMLFLAPEYTGSFPKFVAAMHHGKSFDDACQSAFGKSSTQVYADLKKYFERKKMYGRVFKAQLGKSASPPAVTPVDAFDASLVLADVLAAIGRRAEAKEEYAALHSQQPGRFEVSESLGYLAFVEKDAAAARQNFEDAFAAGDSDPQLCFELAMLDRNAKQPAAKIVGALERAVHSKPGYTDALLQLGLMRIADEQYESGLDALMRIDKIPPEKATPVFAALAYGHLETGDLARARKEVETAKQYARTPDETRRADRMVVMIDARARSLAPPHPGEKIQKVEGTLRQVTCSDSGNRVSLTVGEKVMIFDLPDAQAVEFVHQGEGALSLACGPQKPLPLRVEYAPSSIVDQASAGVIRRLEY